MGQAPGPAYKDNLNNEILEHNNFLDVATFRVINTLQFLELSSLLPEPDLL